MSSDRDLEAEVAGGVSMAAGDFHTLRVPEASSTDQPTSEQSKPRTSADPFSTFLVSALPAAGLAEPLTAEAASETAGGALAVLLRRLLRQSAAASGKAKHVNDLNRRSVAILLYIGDAQPHQIDEVTNTLQLQLREVREQAQSMAEAGLITLSNDGQVLELTRQGRSMIVQVSANMAS